MIQSKIISNFFKVIKNDSLDVYTIAFFLVISNQWVENGCKPFFLTDLYLKEFLNISRPKIHKAKILLHQLGLINFTIVNRRPTEYRLGPMFHDVGTMFNDDTKAQFTSSAEKSTVERKPKKSPVKKKLPVSINTPDPVLPIINQTPVGAPSLDEFISYAKELSLYESRDIVLLEEKYAKWCASGWKNDRGAYINDWKKLLKSIYVILKQGSTFTKLPTISRPQK